MSFLSNIYEVVEKESDVFYKIKLANKNHEIFRAHFPDNPILPGFVQIDICSDLFDIKFTKIKKAKFINMLIPEDIVHVKLNKNKLTLTTETSKISEIIYE